MTPAQLTGMVRDASNWAFKLDLQESGSPPASLRAQERERERGREREREREGERAETASASYEKTFAMCQSHANVDPFAASLTPEKQPLCSSCAHVCELAAFLARTNLPGRCPLPPSLSAIKTHTDVQTHTCTTRRWKYSPSILGPGL
jgi:hypothetical protein